MSTITGHTTPSSSLIDLRIERFISEFCTSDNFVSKLDKIRNLSDWCYICTRNSTQSNHISHSIFVCIVMLLIELSYRQDKRMDELNLFIEYYSKYIVSII